MVPDDLKPTYGRLLAREPDAYKAALALCSGDVGKSLWVADHWANDEAVIAERNSERKRIREEELPGKTDLKSKVWDMIGSPYFGPKDRIAAAKLYAELNGFIEKAPVVQNNNNVTIAPKVIAIPQMSDTEWEAEAERQQRELLNVATRH